jgi:hypothetical protein
MRGRAVCGQQEALGESRMNNTASLMKVLLMALAIPIIGFGVSYSIINDMNLILRSFKEIGVTVYTSKLVGA